MYIWRPTNIFAVRRIHASAAAYVLGGRCIYSTAAEYMRYFVDLFPVTLFNAFCLASLIRNKQSYVASYFANTQDIEMFQHDSDPDIFFLYVTFL